MKGSQQLLEWECYECLSNREDEESQLICPVSGLILIHKID